MFDDLIAVSSAAWGIPIPWIQGVIQVESSWNPDARSSAGAIGLMQIMPATGAGYGVADSSKLYDPATNIDTGTHLLADLRNTYGDDLNAILSAYNSGNPTWYTTNPQIAAYVSKVESAIESFLSANPLVTQSASAGLLIVAVLMWAWFRQKKKRK